MKTPSRPLFLWSPSPDTGLAAVSMILMLVFTTIWRNVLAGGWVGALIHGLIVAVGLRAFLPLYWMVVKRKRGLGPLGITRKNWLLSMLLSLLLACLSFLVFSLNFEIGKGYIPGFVIGFSSLGSVVFIHGWLQLRFDEAFGILPGILLAGVCISLFNLGAPWYDFSMYLRYLLLGLILACLFRVTKNILILWPFVFTVCLPYISQGTGSLGRWTSAGYQTVYFVITVLFVSLFYRIQKRGIKPLTVKVLWGMGIVAAVSLGYLWQKELHIRTAQKAKCLCSTVFVSKRPPDTVLSEELAGYRNIHAAIDYAEKTVSATFLGLAKRRAIFREGLGCTPVIEFSEQEVRKQPPGCRSLLPPAPQDLIWPDGQRAATAPLPPEIDGKVLLGALDKAFSEPRPNRRPRTKAVVVVYNGRIIAERYAAGFSQSTPIVGHSMTKSVMNALVGILVRQGKLSITERAPVPEWSTTGDPRGAITVDQLLRMSSGLKWREEYFGPFEDTAIMKYERGDTAGYAAGKPLASKPDTVWNYSTGTTTIIARIIRDALGGTQADYFAFPCRALFDPLGMRSAIIETDASGTFFGGSLMYATARDWARLGLLYLQDGVWKGERILPEGWVAYTRTPTPTAPLGAYGAQFWLNAGLPAGERKRGAPQLPVWVAWRSPYDTQERLFPRLPADLYTMWGYGGQFVTILPSKRLVVVRLGHGMDKLGWSAWRHESFIADILKAIP